MRWKVVTLKNYAGKPLKLRKMFPDFPFEQIAADILNFPWKHKQYDIPQRKMELSLKEKRLIGHIFEITAKERTAFIHTPEYLLKFLLLSS